MSNLQQRQVILQWKKKDNTFRDFLREIPSWYPLVLYKNQGLTSLYPDTQRSCPVISQKEFEDRIPDLTSQWLEYDFDMSFFENFKKLFLETPFSALYNYSGAENSDFAFSVLNSKNCYLSFTVITDCENIVYSFAVKEWCRNVFASIQISNASENVWQSACVIKWYNIFYSKFIENSSEIRFSTNLVGCHECVLCDNLKNQKYCIRNKKYPKEEYFDLKNTILANKEDYEKNYSALTSIGQNLGSKNVSDSNFVLNSEDVHQGMYSFNLKNAKNTLIVWSPNINEDIYDAFEAWSLGNSHMYGVINTGVNSEQIYNSEGIVTCYSVYYSRFLENCKYCLGCIWLRNQEYCILNKQYTKEDWFDVVGKIFQKMEQTWDLWKYFPWWLCPFYFNDTIASLVWDFTKEEVEAAWYLRRDEEIAVDIPDRMEVVEVSALGEYEGRIDAQWQIIRHSERSEESRQDDPTWDPLLHSGWQPEREESTRRIDPDILKKVIKDEQWNIYRVIKMEYDFLIKYGLPLPRKHWLERLKGHFRVK